jgi:recombinational DNA repair protein (RecF pathway)
MRLCDEMGVRPEVDRCVECDRLLAAGDEVRWIPRLGGVLCGRHGGPSMAAAGLSSDALKVLKAYQRMDVEALAGLRLPGAVEVEVERVLGEFVRHVMERDTRSRRFLEEVKAGYGDGPAASPGTSREGGPRADPPTQATSAMRGGPPTPEPEGGSR